jgi:exodeoxyribonuclease III
MKITSYNVAGLRAMLKKSTFESFIKDNDFDIICLQETKAEESQVELPEYISSKYNYRFWNSTKGTTQRRGLSGTAIWSKLNPIKVLETPVFDEEGRIISIEFEKFILINVYVPNSQKLDSDRYNFRDNWNKLFIQYVRNLKLIKPVVICGDLNVAHNEIDICNPRSKINKVPGFFNNEREDFSKLLNDNLLVDIYRCKNSNLQKSTYWSNFLKQPRSDTNGWRIDYFLTCTNFYDNIKDIKILDNIIGSDHCPVVLEIDNV